MRCPGILSPLPHISYNVLKPEFVLREVCHRGGADEAVEALVLVREDALPDVDTKNIFLL